jgi:hypothetical protein
MDNLSNNYALLAAQNGLLNAVSEELLAVIVDLSKETKVLYIRFYYDKAISEVTLDVWSCAIAEISSGMGADCSTEEKIEKINHIDEIPKKGYFAYLRKTSIANDELLKIKEKFTLPYQEEKFTFSNIKRVMQNSLLGKISSNIKEIALNYNESHITVHFYYEGPIASIDNQNMHEVMNEFCKNFPSYYIFLRSFRIDKANILPEHPAIVYMRYEKDYDNTPYYSPQN